MISWFCIDYSASCNLWFTEELIDDSWNLIGWYSLMKKEALWQGQQQQLITFSSVENKKQNKLV